MPLTHADVHVRSKEMNGKYKSIGKKQSSLLVFLLVSKRW